jgi:lysozyme family protein
VTISILDMLDRIIVNEGGYVHSSNDPGGETKYGISKRYHQDVCIKNLTIERAKHIYMDEYVSHIPYNKVHPSVVWQILDYGVNSGMKTAILLAQKISGAHQDGIFGPQTIKSVNRLMPAIFIIEFLSCRLNMLMSLRTWDHFGKGWSKRLSDCLIQAASDIHEQWEQSI